MTTLSAREQGAETACVDGVASRGRVWMLGASSTMRMVGGDGRVWAVRVAYFCRSVLLDCVWAT